MDFQVRMAHTCDNHIVRPSVRGKKNYSKELAISPTKKNEGCENNFQKSPEEILIWSCLSTSHSLTMPKNSRSCFIRFHMFYVVKFRLTLARFAAPRMESSLQEAKQTLTHFWGCGRASKLQQTEEKKWKGSSQAQSSPQCWTNSTVEPQVKSCRSRRHYTQQATL